MRTLAVSILVAVAAMLWLAANATAELRPDPPPGAKRAHVDARWRYTVDATWTATDGSKIHVRCKRFSEGFRCRILSIEWGGSVG